MLPPLDAPESAMVLAGIEAVGWLSLGVLLRPWWRRREVRALAIGLSAAPYVGVAMWLLGPSIGSYPVSYYGMAATWAILVPLAFLVASLPVAAAVSWAIRAVTPGSAARVRERAMPAGALQTARHELASALVTRRAMLQGVAAVVPISAASVGAGGLLRAWDPQHVRRVRLTFPELPDDLRGLRILQLSDLHLGCDMNVDDLERVLSQVGSSGSDVVVVTGDIADDLSQLAPALEVLAAYRPPLGSYVCLGNHEYLHDIGQTLPILMRGPLPILRDNAVTLEVGRALVHLGGADDPIRDTRKAMDDFHEATVRATMAGAPERAFRMLMAHRPNAFDAAARQGVELTLSGHTHGGQVGFHQRSLLERRHPERYVWGSYRKGASRLYVTSGFGQWFPFRLGCPAEVPIITLACARA